MNKVTLASCLQSDISILFTSDFSASLARNLIRYLRRDEQSDISFLTTKSKLDQVSKMG